jgi:PAS domain S-box-containing protein
MSMLKSLPAKVIFAMLAITAVTLVLGFSFFLRIEREEYTTAMKKGTAQVSVEILASLDRSMLENDSRRTVEIMRTLSSANGIEHLMIVNPKGIVALSPHESERGRALSSPPDLCTVCHRGPARDGNLVFAYNQASGGEVFRNIIPIIGRDECQSCHRGERFLGLLVSDIDAGPFRAHLTSQIRRFASIALVIFATITLALSILVHRLIRQPIGDLMKGTVEMARGNYGHRIADGSRDELGLLAESFNQMADKVRQSRGILERWNVTLEDEVGKRTEELRRSNRELEERKNLTESVVRSVAEGILAVDHDGKIIQTNGVIGRLFGLDESSLTGLALSDLVRGSAGRFENPDEVAAFLTSTETNAPERAEVRQVSPVRRMFRVSRSRVFAGREDRGSVFSFHDMTREKEIDDIKTNLVAMVSHELRTPLTAIKGALSLMSDGNLVGPRERDEFQAIALTNTDRLIELINNILDLARIESKSISYERASFSIEPLLHRAVESVAGFARRSGNVVVVDVDKDIGEMTGDAFKIEQVVINLLTNAIKFSPTGGEVRVVARVVGNTHEISVADRGMGIPQEALDKIFEKFYQVDMSAIRKIGGSGLGLSICKAIVEGHGGKIRVESEPGRGSVFTFSVPRVVEYVSTEARPDEPVVSAAVSARRILVVEDDPAVRKVLVRFLEGRGFGVIQAGSAREALDLARMVRPDCITVDVMLPDLDGFDLTAILKSDPRTRDIPVVFITVMDGVGRARGLDLGAVAYFNKPVEYEAVAARIEVILGGEAPPPKGRVLLVNGEVEGLRSLGGFLETKRLAVEYSSSGPEALEILRLHRPTVVILDTALQGKTGFDLIGALRRDPGLSNLPLILLTQRSGGPVTTSPFDFGAAVCLEKPVLPEELWHEIEKVIG